MAMMLAVVASGGDVVSDNSGSDASSSGVGVVVAVRC